jgi:hypothetical protein
MPVRIIDGGSAVGHGDNKATKLLNFLASVYGHVARAGYHDLLAFDVGVK